MSKDCEKYKNQGCILKKSSKSAPLCPTLNIDITRQII